MEVVDIRSISREERATIEAKWRVNTPERFVRAVHFVPYGAAAPAGTVPDQRLLSGMSYYDMLAHGFCPMAGASTTLVGGAEAGFTQFLHDLAHFTGFMQNPEFMASLAQSARRLATPELRARYKGPFDTLSARSLFLTEYLYEFRSPRGSPRGALQLDLPDAVFDGDDLLDDFLTVEAVLSHLNTMSPRALGRLAERVLRLFREQATPLGGGARDIITTSVRVSDGTSMHPADIFQLLEGLLRSRTRPHPAPVHEAHQHTPQALRRSLARAIVAFHEFSHVPLVDLVREGHATGRLTEGNPLWRLCASGLVVDGFEARYLCQ
jgi:hypothetical protein